MRIGMKVEGDQVYADLYISGTRKARSVFRVGGNEAPTLSIVAGIPDDQRAAREYCEGVLKLIDFTETLYVTWEL